MLYWKYSDDRIFFLNEYWILIPPAILLEAFVIRQIRSYKRRQEELKKFKEMLARYEKERKLRDLRCLAIGLTGLSYILMYRAGSIDSRDFIDVNYIDCGIDEGVHFLNDERLINIVHDLFKSKRRHGVIQITATALCQVANHYGILFLSLPIAVGDFGVTNLYQVLRKAMVTGLAMATSTYYFLYGPTPIVGLLGSLGLKMAFINLDEISTSAIDLTNISRLKDVKPRIAQRKEVIILNLQKKLGILPQESGKQHCWLAEQALLNPDCKAENFQTPTVLDDALSYDDVVNMRDVTGLKRETFTDIDQVQPSKAASCTSPIAKQVNFLDRFSDPDVIEDKNTWDCDHTHIPEVSERKNLRTRNTD